MLIGLSQFIISADYNLIFVALPAVGHDLHLAGQALQLVVVAYAATFAGCVLLAGRATDVLGARRVFTLGAALFGATSILGAVASTGWMLIAARGAQGIAAAALFPSGLALVIGTFPAGPAQRRALAIWGSAGAVGMSVGSLLGGALTTALGWRAVLLVNVPAAAAAAIGTARLIRPGHRRRPRRSLDLAGSLAALIGLSCLVVVLVLGPKVGWEPSALWLPAASALCAGAAFVVVELRAKDPVLPRRRLSLTLGSTAAVTFVLLGLLSSAFYVLTLYLQNVAGYTALETGLGLLPLTAAMVVGMQCGSRLVGRGGPRLLAVLGQLAMGAAIAWVGIVLAAPHPYVHLALPLTLFGLGGGITWTAAFTTAAADADGAEYGLVASVICAARQVGSAAVVAALTPIIAADGTDPAAQAGGHTGLQAAAYASAGLSLLGAAAAFGLDVPPHRGRQHSRRGAHGAQV
ncbi:MFS transporter [Amycolatopsis sp. 3B14]|uniref:MFS transporter n=1 Tax=Amycolatopsis sp. 3B14 TaxID=3243600 RepID=UPI003D97CE00